jgi:transposase InsO family protein
MRIEPPWSPPIARSTWPRPAFDAPHAAFSRCAVMPTTFRNFRTVMLNLRRQQLRHPAYQKPELLAEKPNEVWSWDITKLMGPAKWSYYNLYVILDIFSRRVVGWCVADAESATLFQPLFDDAVIKLVADR